MSILTPRTCIPTQHIFQLLKQFTRIKFLIGVLICFQVVSCNDSSDINSESNLSEDINILKPTAVVDVSQPVVVDSLPSPTTLNIERQQIALKLKQTLKDPHMPEPLTYTDLGTLDSTTFIKTTLGKNGVPGPFTHTIYDTETPIEVNDTLLRRHHVLAKRAKAKKVGFPATTIPNQLYDLQALKLEDFPYSLRHMHEDSKGVLWAITSNNSLIQYDGVSVIEYNKNEGFTASNINAFHIDRNDVVWVGTQGNGLISFDGHRFTHYASGVLNTIIFDIKSDPSNTIWIGTRSNGLLKLSNFNSDHETIEQFTNVHGLSQSNFAGDINISPSGNLWVSTGENDLLHFDHSTFTKLTPVSELINDVILDKIIDQTGHLWITTINKNKLFKYDTHNNKLFEVNILPDQPYELLADLKVDSNNRVWGSTFYHGPFVIQDSSYYRVFDSKNQPIYSYAFASSKQGFMWIISDQKISKLNLDSFKYLPYDYNIFQDPIFKNPEVRLQRGTNNHLWMVSGGKLINYDGTTFSEYRLDPEDVISDLIMDTNNRLWIKGGNGIYRYDNQSIVKFDLKDIITLLEGDNGSVIAADSKSLYTFENDIVSQRDFFSTVLNYANLSGTVKDLWGRFWLGTEDGLFMMKDGLLYKFENLDQVNGIKIINLLVDHNGDLLITTANALYKLTLNKNDFEGSQLVSYSESKILDGAPTSTLTLSPNGTIWLQSTEFIPIEGKANYYKVKHLSKQGFTGGHSIDQEFTAINNKNEVWWSRAQHLMKLDKNDTEKHQDSLHIQLKDILINDQYIDFSQIKDSSYTSNLKRHKQLVKMNQTAAPFSNYPEQLTLPHTMKHLTFNFSAVDWGDSNTLQYQFKIEGQDDTWSALTSNTFADYRNISYGDHVFKVRAVNTSGVWSPVFEYPFTVNPPWWLSWWAKMIWIALVAVAVIGLAELRIKAIRKKIKKEETFKSKILQLESKALRAQMNPHFIFNALNGIQSHMFLHGELATNKYIGAFAKLLRMTLDMSSSDMISLEDEIHYIEAYLQLESMRIGQTFKSSVVVEDSIDKAHTKIPCMLFQPLIENAILHGLLPIEGEKQLKISMAVEGNHLRGIVEDNGIGRKEATERKRRKSFNHKSMATRIMKERFDISNSINKFKLSIKTIDLMNDGKPNGTKVILQIPITQTFN